MAATEKFTDAEIQQIKALPPRHIAEIWPKLSDAEKQMIVPHLSPEQRAARDKAKEAAKGHQSSKPPEQKPQQSNQGNGGQQMSGGQQKESPAWVLNNNLFGRLATPAKFCFYILIGFVCVLNWQPYIKLIESLDTVTGAGAWLRSLWIIGFMVNWIWPIVITVTGVAVWGVMQFFELLHLLVKPHLNRLGDGFLKSVWIFVLVAYLIDFFLAWITYPPLKTDIGVFLSSPDLADINWENLKAFLVMVFAVEAVVYGLLMVSYVIEKVGVKRNANA